MNASGPITQFPSEGLRKAKRFITSHNEEGKGVFIQEDHGDFETVMGDGQAVRLDLFTTEKFPIDMNDEKDVKWSSSVRVRQFPCLPRSTSISDV